MNLRMKLESVNSSSNILLALMWNTLFIKSRPWTSDVTTRSSTRKKERERERGKILNQQKKMSVSIHQCLFLPSSFVSEPLCSDASFWLALTSRESADRLETRSGARRSSEGAGLRGWEGGLRASSCRREIKNNKIKKGTYYAFWVFPFLWFVISFVCM